MIDNKLNSHGINVISSELIQKLQDLGIIIYIEKLNDWIINPSYEQGALPRSLGFDEIAISQQKNMCKSRLDADITSEVVRGIKLKIPIIAANMSTVTNADFAIKLHKLGALAILHRAQPEAQILAEIKRVASKCSIVAASIGIDSGQFEFTKKMVKAGCNIITIDIANSYTERAIELARKIKEYSTDIKIILGNTTNIGLMEEADFVDAIKVGIAQGYACETKNTAGCTEKQFSAIFKFKDVAKRIGMPIISDGGIREPADFVKSIGAGANSIMAGKIFAACPESAAETEIINGANKKIYAGMASRYVQDRWRGGLKEGTCPEGGVRYLDIGESADKLLERYSGALRSGISYSNASDIESFQRNVKFIRIK